MTFTPRLFVIVGTPGSGKDLLIRAVNNFGALHADIVPKHTSRARREDDDKEMICLGEPACDLEGCDIEYENYATKYGIKSDGIWRGLRGGRFQVAVVSDLEAIKELERIFGDLVVLVYVHSNVDARKYQIEEMERGDDVGYVKRRVKEYDRAYRLYLEYFLAFNHVLIYANEGLDEDLYDQIFRLFRAYKRRDLSHTIARPVASGMIGKDKEPPPSRKIIGGSTVQ